METVEDRILMVAWDLGRWMQDEEYGYYGLVRIRVDGAPGV